MRRLQRALAAAALLVGGLALPACGSTESTADFVTSGACDGERAAVQRALARSTLRVDVDGDGQLDKVAVVTRPDAGRRCRVLVGVRLQDGSTYSTHLFPAAVPFKGLRARIVGLPDLGEAKGAEIVVDTRAAVDAVLAQLFTLTPAGLHRVRVPVFDNGTFIVEGGGVVYPYGAGCTADGRMILSTAEQSSDGKTFDVTRKTYSLGGERLRFADPEVTTDTVPVDRLADRFPEFTHPHWKACTGTVRR